MKSSSMQMLNVCHSKHWGIVFTFMYSILHTPLSIYINSYTHIRAFEVSLNEYIDTDSLGASLIISGTGKALDIM